MEAVWRGKWALVTGASAGIGVALAEELVHGGTNLVLTARRKDRLEALARRLSSTYKIKTEVLPADLTDLSAPEKIFAFTRDEQFLREQAYPIMKGAAEFFLDTLVENPTNH